MIEVFQSGGVMMWPMLAVTVGIFVLVVRAAILIGQGEADPRIDSALAGILFWGGIAAVLGLLGTTVGLVQVGRVVARFETVSTAMLSDGLAVTLVTTIFGLLVLLVAGLSWFSLRHWRSGPPRPAGVPSAR